MSAIRARIEEMQSIQDAAPRLIGWAFFPAAPNGIVTINGANWFVIGARWVVETLQSEWPLKSDEAFLVLAVSTPEVYRKIQLDMARQQAGGGPSLVIPTGPVPTKERLNSTSAMGRR